jgi:uncharacterized membrane protein YtjA (UPF0391 family)
VAPRCGGGDSTARDAKRGHPQAARWNFLGGEPLLPLKKWDCVMSLLKWALIFFLVSIVAAVFGFTGISAATADIARILFYVFLVIFVVLLVLGVAAARRV